MSILDALELEEKVGRFWHRLVGERHSWPRHPHAACSLEQVRNALAVFFRGLGGDRGLAITAASLKTSTHRLNWRQRIGMEDERLPTASRDQVSLSLPDQLDSFPDHQQNRDLYFWLAAYFTALPGVEEPPTDPLQADLRFLWRAQRATQSVLDMCPGLRTRHGALRTALRELRPTRPTEGIEKQIEQLVQAMLGADLPANHPFASILAGQWPQTLPAAPFGYKPFLPVPLWGEALHQEPQIRPDEPEDEQGEASKPGEEQDEKKRRAERKTQDNANRKDPLLLNRFEKILSLADMVNVNRGADDPDEEEAKKAADDMEKITLAPHSKKAATKLKFDLDLPPEATDPTRLTGQFLYPEWDFRRACYHKDHCQVLTGVIDEQETGDIWQPDDSAQRRIRQVKRQFEALRTKALILHAQMDGSELDMDALVRARTDLAASGLCSDRVYMQRRPMERDLAVQVLIDASLSTDAWIENRRVLDVEKEALAVFSHGLAACGDSFAIHSFSSRKRAFVKIDTIKDFDEPFGPRIMGRIGALKPGYYTRIGTAIRHAAAQLEQRPNRHRLLLVITDGKPNDVDHYEGRYGLEDTRKAVHEVRAKGMVVFGVTIDRKAQSYFPHIFGRGSFAIIHHLAQLSAALPRIYRHLAAG